ncbi:hypothetical protein ACFX10_018905 [Malus domestica]
MIGGSSNQTKLLPLDKANLARWCATPFHKRLAWIHLTIGKLDASCRTSSAIIPSTKASERVIECCNNLQTVALHHHLLETLLLSQLQAKPNCIHLKDRN